MPLDANVTLNVQLDKAVREGGFKKERNRNVVSGAMSGIFRVASAALLLVAFLERTPLASAVFSLQCDGRFRAATIKFVTNSECPGLVGSRDAGPDVRVLLFGRVTW